MSFSEPRPDDALASLLTRVRGFEQQELWWPASLSLGEYLRQLAAERVVTSEVAHAVAALYHHGRYGGGAAEAGALTQALVDLQQAQQALESLDPEVRQRLQERWRERVLPRAVPQAPAELPAPRPSGSAPRDMEPGSTERQESFGEEAAVPLTGPVRPAPRMGLLVKAGALAAWTLLVGTSAFILHDRVARGVRAARVTLQLESAPEVNETDLDIQILRQNLAQQYRLSTDSSMGAASPQRRMLQGAPSPLADLKRLAELHWERHEYADAIAAYQAAIARSRDDPDLHNSLGWLLLTARDPVYRDPVQALALAERAVALSRQPIYLDTLAEASFQTGDAPRAIELEEEAIALQSPPLPFLYSQLQKFRAPQPRRRQRAIAVPPRMIAPHVAPPHIAAP